MLNTKKLLEMARKSKAMAILGKKRIQCSSMVAEKGHFILYTCEGKRFMVPISFLKSNVFEELIEKAEEEFGLPQDRPIKLPYDAAFLKQVLSLLKRGSEEDHCLRSSSSDFGHCKQLAVF